MSKAIPVRQVQFASPQDGPGFTVASAISSQAQDGRPAKYALSYDPQWRLLRVTHLASRDTGFIPAERVACIRFAEPILDETPAPAPAPSSKK